MGVRLIEVSLYFGQHSEVGEHVCACMQTTDSGYTARVKLSNKIVSQFEAGEVQDPLEVILRITSVLQANTFAKVLSSQKCKKRLYSNRSVLRLPRAGDFHRNSGRMVQNTLVDLSSKGEGLLVVQPPKSQW